MLPVKRERPVFDEANPPDPVAYYKAGEEVRKRSDESEWLMVNAIRVLAIDMVESAKSGHPGAPMGLAPLAYTLFSKVMQYNPLNPRWPNRDRFVLSNGHACALQYALLHLYGFDLPLEELKRFRQVKSLTPGHPEANHTPGIEVSSGPLGQGFAAAVGLAISEKHLGAVFNRTGYDVIFHYTFCIAGDGCMQEGISSEAASLAGHLGLGRLIVLYDDNHVQIDGSTDLAFTEDVLARFRAYGWHTSQVEDGDNDLPGLLYAIEEAKLVTDRPSLIKVTTTIGFGSLHQGTEKVHGTALGADIAAKVKALYGHDPSKHFHIEDHIRDLFALYRTRGINLEKLHSDMLHRYQEEYPDLAAEYYRRFRGELPKDWKANLPRYQATDKPSGTRKYSETVLKAIAKSVPELIGGSADLTGSNLTKISEDFQKGSPQNRYIRFGVREHGMCGISNGIASHGGLIPFSATFLNFYGYAQGAYRLSALSKFRILFIATHDSIGLGEDGPTHQPIETLESMRATPNLLTMRPADGNEVTGCYIVAMETFDKPSVISLTRQNAPHLSGSAVEKVALGAYPIWESTENSGGSAAEKSRKKSEAGQPDLILVATGSEVSLCIQAAKVLKEAENINVRVISMPINRIFDHQSLDYKLSLFPTGIPCISVEASSKRGWRQYSHFQIGLETFGLSGPFEDVYKALNLTSDAIVAKAKSVLGYFKDVPVPALFYPDA